MSILPLDLLLVFSFFLFYVKFLELYIEFPGIQDAIPSPKLHGADSFNRREDGPYLAKDNKVRVWEPESVSQGGIRTTSAKSELINWRLNIKEKRKLNPSVISTYS